MGRKILAINPGSTSTKIAIYNEKECIYEETLRHSSEEIAKFETVYDQYQFRKDIILDALSKSGVEIIELTAVVGRGGMLKPISSGTYAVNDAMVEYVKATPRGEHASNLGCIIAREIADSVNIGSYIVDPVAVDEMDDIAKITGMPQFPRDSLFHALNQKAVAKRHAKVVEKSYEDLNLIVAHLGGGISVGAHKKGLVVDVNNALDGDGPMSPERSGTVPLGKLYNAIFEGKYTQKEVKQMNYGKGGLVAHLGSNNGLEIAEMIEDGDEKAKLVFNALAYQVSKEIGGLSTVLQGSVDGILITGGLAYNKMLTSWIKENVSFIGEVYIYPGEDELQALVEGVIRVLDGEEEVQTY